MEHVAPRGIERIQFLPAVRVFVQTKGVHLHCGAIEPFQRRKRQADMHGITVFRARYFRSEGRRELLQYPHTLRKRDLAPEPYPERRYFQFIVAGKIAVRREKHFHRVSLPDVLVVLLKRADQICVRR